MYDYDLRLWKKICCINTQYRDSSLQYFPKQSRNTSLFKQLIKKGQEDQSLQRYLFFPLFLFPDAVFAYISHAYHQKTREEKRWLLWFPIWSWLKENISLRNLAFIIYEEAILTGYKYIQRSLEDALFCNARLELMRYLKWCPSVKPINIRIKQTSSSLL
jgi:hypothetical protein